jgi:hypothetical protein
VTSKIDLVAQTVHATVLICDAMWNEMEKIMFHVPQRLRQKERGIAFLPPSRVAVRGVPSGETTVFHQLLQRRCFKEAVEPSISNNRSPFPTKLVTPILPKLINWVYLRP